MNINPMRIVRIATFVTLATTLVVAAPASADLNLSSLGPCVTEYTGDALIHAGTATKAAGNLNTGGATSSAIRAGWAGVEFAFCTLY